MYIHLKKILVYCFFELKVILNLTALRIIISTILLTIGLGAFKLPHAENAVSIQFKLNVKTDTVFNSFAEFEVNDSIVFADKEIGKQYKLVNYELRLLARPKELYHNVLRTPLLPKSEIKRYCNSAEGTTTVFFSDIRVVSLKDNQITKAKSFKFKIKKAKD